MDGKSRNLTEDYIKQIKALFPEAVTEVADNEGNNITHKIDMEKLAILLGEAAIPTDETEYRQKYGEKFSFEWAGKRRAIAEAQKRSTGTLRPCPAESVDWDTTENLYIEGDNLEVLKLLQDSYIGAVKMIYIDPPYNTGKDFVYKDNYKDNLANYLEQTNTTNAVNTEASGRYHTNWLNMMYPRLKLARNLLSEDGVIFISIDDNEVSNLKSICDEVFGEDNFVSTLVWNTEGHTDNQFQIKNNHEYIYLYCKNINQLKLGYTIDPNIREDSNLWKGFAENSITKNGPANPPSEVVLEPGFPCKQLEGIIKSNKPSTSFFEEVNSQGYITRQITEKYNVSYPIRYENMVISDNKLVNQVKVFTGWGNLNKLKSYINNKYIPIIENDGSELSFYLSENGVVYYYRKRNEARNILSVLKNLGTTEQMRSELEKSKLFFTYPKPKQLLSYLCKIGNIGNNNIILDFFSGSATTADAVMQLNAEDGGNRKYICVQIPEPTPEDCEARKAGYNTIPEIAKERIRRAGKKILEEQKAKNDGLFADEAPKLDIGFKVFKLDRSNVKEWDVELEGLNEQQAALQLQAEFDKTLDILKDGRTELDILYEVMLKLGLLLTTHVKEVNIEGKKAFVVGDGVMVASFAKGLTYAQISKMLDLKAGFVQAGEFKVVFADESFASDNDKTNAMQLFKQRGITNYEII